VAARKGCALQIAGERRTTCDHVAQVVLADGAQDRLVGRGLGSRRARGSFLVVPSQGV
jgi:hypothetical protein